MSASFIGAVNRLRGLQVVVIGDVMLDTYLSGLSHRLCQEAPVPVVAVNRTQESPGGAANVAVNALALGADVRLVSVIGDDWEGDLLAERLKSLGVPVDDGGLVRQPGRRSLAKTRVLSGDHMLVRFDQGSTQPISAEVEAAAIRRLTDLVSSVEVILVSDYGYGMMTSAVVAALAAAQAAGPRIMGVDAKRLPAYRQAGVTVAKPNYSQALELLRRRAGMEGDVGADMAADRVQRLLPHGPRLSELCGAQVVAVTMDQEGAVVFEAGSPAYRTYARPHDHLRAAGAGDTFLTALTLGVAAGVDVPAASEMASAAAAVVMGKEGTASCGAWELKEAMSSATKVLSWAQVGSRMEFYRSQGRRIVFTNGCFDILHRGHTTMLSRAKALGDVLVVGLNRDAGVGRLKGAGRPINSITDRSEVLSALSCVDHVVVFEEDDPRELIRLVRPHVFVKGGDYTQEGLVEAAMVEDLGGSVRILPYEAERSTTGVIERIRSQAVLRGAPAGQA